MSAKTIENFFTGKTLLIPSYQRDYAWRECNVSAGCAQPKISFNRNMRSTRSADIAPQVAVQWSI